MSFDWPALLEQHGVEYVTSGPNIGRGHVGVRCPFCGASDPSHHMAISLEDRGWICRRERAHAGKSPVRLVQALLGCTHEEARRLVGFPTMGASSGLLERVQAQLGRAPEAPAAAPLREPPEFKRFDAALPSALPYARYMQRRGFPQDFLRGEATALGLRYCVRGAQAGRVVFLVHQEGKLVNWTGRSLSPNARLRYRVLSADPEVAARDGLPAAPLSIERCLLFYDELRAGGRELFLVEGPMDALKLRLLGRQATCIFTSSPSRWQVDLLRDIAPGFDRRVVLLDRGAEAPTFKTTRELAALGFSAGWLPAGADDPGELTAKLLAKMG